MREVYVSGGARGFPATVLIVAPVQPAGLVTRPAGLLIPATGISINPGERVSVSATITNVGDKSGYFKLFGFVYHQWGPSAGPSRGYYDAVNKYYQANAGNTAAMFESGEFQLVPQASRQFSAITRETLIQPGTYRGYMVAAVRETLGGPRLFDREAYGYDFAAFEVAKPLQPQPPSAPGAPYKISQSCTGGGKARVTVGWGVATGARYYEVYHASGELKAVVSGTSVTIYDVPTYPPGGAWLTLYVKACNNAGCTQGPNGKMWINPCS